MSKELAFIYAIFGVLWPLLVMALCVLWANQEPPEITYMGDPAIYEFIKNGG